MTTNQNTTTEGSPGPFSATLRDFRQELGWSQAQAAKCLGISIRAYLYWEKGTGAHQPHRVTQIGAWYLLTQAVKSNR